MIWPNVGDDEVKVFHSAFAEVAAEALTALGAAEVEWVHHLRTPANTLVPDFVLTRKSDGAWLLCVELKRTREAVRGTRNQLQAKSYAELNVARYAASVPRYYAITNFEMTLVFALHGTAPPVESQVEGGQWESGRLGFETSNHRAQFLADLVALTNLVLTVRSPRFERVWPTVLQALKDRSAAVPAGNFLIEEPKTPNWSVVRDFFAGPEPTSSARLLLLRCLMVEYLRGALSAAGHPRATTLPPLRSRDPRGSVATAVEFMRLIDFQFMFDGECSALFRGLDVRIARDHVGPYINEIMTAPTRVAELASRVDAPQLIDSLMATFWPVREQDESGKVTTDADLAALLATLAVRIPTDRVIDPCCGDGILLMAADNELERLGAGVGETLSLVCGIEADPVAARLACVRLALRHTTVLSPGAMPSVAQADLFCCEDAIGEADVVLMNPPFKRYEAQDAHPAPEALRAHYAASIRRLGGREPIGLEGQANLYMFYAEFVARAMKPGATLAVILDNKWYHNRYGEPLRRLVLQHFEIEALVEYPHPAFFAGWTIGTSILVARRETKPNPDHSVRFVRARTDPAQADLNDVKAAFRGSGQWPLDWTSQAKRQGDLTAGSGWKALFVAAMRNDYRTLGLPILDDLFEYGRRGSLEKEGGGIEALESPFGRTDYGPRRKRAPGGSRPFQTLVDRRLDREENTELARLARAIPKAFRGRAIRNADDLTAYVLGPSDVTRRETLEPPALRLRRDLFTQRRRSPWTSAHDEAVSQIRADAEAGAYLEALERVVNLTEAVLPREQLWNVLREPYAGELVVPRKTRGGHRVHINPFALDPDAQQVRASTNFLTYTNCQAIDEGSGLDRSTAATLIAAFLVSSFGQLQFEEEGANREGALSLEKHHFQLIGVFDPRWVRPAARTPILVAFSQLPYPVASSQLSPEQPERNALDALWAEEITARFPTVSGAELLGEVHQRLDEWIMAREP